MVAHQPDAAPIDGPDMTHWVSMYEVDVARLRGLGCRCALYCGVQGDRIFAVPLNESVAATCIVDHSRSYTT